MLKKTVFAGGGVLMLLLIGLVFGRSHVLTSKDMIKQAVQDSIPIEYELNRARTMIRELEPEIRRNMHLIAREDVAVANLVRQVEQSEEKLAQGRDAMLRLKDDLQRGDSTYVYAGTSYTAKQVKADLENRFARYETQEETTANLQQVLRARQRGLEAAREKLKSMLAARGQLEAEVANLEARLKMVEVAQASSNIHFDDSHLSKTKELIQGIQTRIDVAERLVNAEGHFHDQIPLDDEQDDDILDTIAEKFGDQRSEIEALVRGTD